jgi:serine/threonine protein kinase
MTPPQAGPDPTRSQSPKPSPSRIGHYVITGKLGQGGMGIVYSARDERLERMVALKTISSVSVDETARRRFWREARAAASVNHPNVCQLFEIGEDQGELFIAMELLEGESLAERLQRGAMTVAETMPIALGMLAALSALHARGVIHRDLKPSNVFLTSHGVKLLDFGLARTNEPELARSMVGVGELTDPGMVVGTPRYIAPEQIAGDPIDARSDLFAAGVILFEMLAGRPTFGGRNVIEILHATLHEQPPALTGSPAIAAIDRVIRRALAKRPADRFESADAMAEELRTLRGVFGEEKPALAHTLTRLVVLPFRVLRPDPETDFLAFSLPDAISTSLARFGSLTVRSSAAAARFAKDAPDLKLLAAEADVDRVVIGTLLRSGEQVQATAQLVEAPAGTLITSQTVLASLGDLFRLQDDIVHRIVDALSLPLAGMTPPSTPDQPRDARAYALYLRGNALALSYDRLMEARSLYRESVELDPTFAPAWAQLGRCDRVIGKYIDSSEDTDGRAEQAFRRALELNPRLSAAHQYYANLECDTGHSIDALARLLGEAERHGNNPELFAGLVHTCRYCGLFEQSMAAHDEARRLDPTIPTSFEQTVLMTGDVERLLASRRPPGVAGGDDVIKVIGLALAGRRTEARERLLDLRRSTRIPAFVPWTSFLMAWLDKNHSDMVANRAVLGTLRIMDDPEAIFQEAWLFTDAGDLDHGLEMARRAVAKGYYVAPTLAEQPHFDPLRGNPEFEKVLAQAVEGRERALRTFHERGGERLLGR